MAKQRSWDELVAAGRAAVDGLEGAQWELGDLCLEVAPLGMQGRGSLSRKTLEAYAFELGLSINTLYYYRTVASRWPRAERRSAAGFSCYAALASHPDRYNVMRELHKQATLEGHRVREDDARAANGRATRAATVVPLKGTLRTAKQIVDNLKAAQIGELIEYAWSVLEGRQAA